MKTFTFPNGNIGTSRMKVIWDGTDDEGRKVTSGIYFYKMKAGNLQRTKKMILMK